MRMALCTHPSGKAFYKLRGNHNNCLVTEYAIIWLFMLVIGIIVIFSWKLIANVDPVIGSAYCNIAILLAPNNWHKVGTLGVGGRYFFCFGA